jgi:metal-responsive CopG/Arc/MetJ family transcriptional regulator
MMRNVTIPLPDTLISYLDAQVDAHEADSRAGLIRRIIARHRETEILAAWREALEEHERGTTFHGNLRTLVKGFKDA